MADRHNCSIHKLGNEFNKAKLVFLKFYEVNCSVNRVADVSRWQAPCLTYLTFFLICVFLLYDVRKWKCFFIVILFSGCGSGHLRECGRLEPRGLILKFLDAGGPSCLGLLWSVTGMYIDVFLWQYVNTFCVFNISLFLSFWADVKWINCN